ncbi:CHASE2 domain-containing protein, partial [Desulfovibrio sp. OttesenSCG-928-G15]|nr:CHASE2 domain-containing protein [Desulfovibrio sp. OttesenSCG-928-G15]
MLYCYVQQPRLLRMLDYKVYDALLHARADSAITGAPVIVDLDEASLDAYGQWPWPRFLVARVLDRLSQNGVAAVGLDMLLAEQDRSSPGKIRDDLKHFLDLDVRFEGLPAEFYDYDQVLAKSLGMAAVLGMYCHFDQAAPEEEKESAKPDAG